MASNRSSTPRPSTGPRLGLLVSLLAAPILCVAQTAPASVAADASGYATGDAWIDRQLADIDAYAQRYPDSFLDELARYLGVRRGYAEGVLKANGWRAGDLYLACAWAQAHARSCRELVRAYSTGHAQGWETVLESQGGADNASYRTVRHAIVASYDRWDRPIELDARLLQQLGDHEARLARAREALPAPAGQDPAPGR